MCLLHNLRVFLTDKTTITVHFILQKKKKKLTDKRNCIREISKDDTHNFGFLVDIILGLYEVHCFTDV